MKTNVIDLPVVARKVLEVVNAGLCSGVGEPVPGKMCVEAAVCYAMGLPHGDQPSCVSPAVRSFKVSLNDRAWSSNMARANGLRRIAIAQLGSAGVVNDREFVAKLAEQTIRQIVPIAFRAAAKVLPKHASELEDAAKRCESEGTRDSVVAARSVANKVYAAYAAAADAADAAAAASAADAAAAAYAADADAAAYASAAADDAADAADAAAAAYAAYAYAYASASAAAASAADAYADADAADKKLNFEIRSTPRWRRSAYKFSANSVRRA